MKRVLAGLVFLLAPTLIAQSTPQPPDAEPHGTVLFSSGTDTAPSQPAARNAPALLGKDDPLGVTDAERSALTFQSYDLDAHLAPAKSSLAVRAVFIVRNDGAAPLKRVVLQLSSTLHWDSISSEGRSLPFASRLVETDAGHTGLMNEAVVTIAAPLAPGATVKLTTLYSGTIPISAERLLRTGAPEAEARAADWDTTAADGTFLRGFGYVLWYPVSAPPISLREGERFFAAIGEDRLRERSTTVRLRLSVEYQGEPPDAVFFGGRRDIMKAISDNPDAPVAEAAGIATAIFVAAPLGLRPMSLFVTARPPVAAGTQAHPDLIQAVTQDEPLLGAYSAAASEVEPLLTYWFGADPQSPLYLIDHAGQPFEDGALLVRSLRPDRAASLSSSLAHSLTHAWIASPQPWIDEGLAEFARVLFVERSQGRDAATNALQGIYRDLQQAELRGSLASAATRVSGVSSSSDAGQGTPGRGGAALADAVDPVLLRDKAVAVWWMLRGIVGDDTLRKAIQVYRSRSAADVDAHGFERVLSGVSHKDLAWFFNDWVYKDAGLPRLSIANVAPSELKGRTGLPDGWLVAVEVRNDGGAAAEVPVTLLSGVSSQTERLRIAAHSSASLRMVFSGTPTEVAVNDGSVPEDGSPVHTRRLVLASH